MSQCYSRCGRDRIPPSAYCRECDAANRAGRRSPLPAASTLARCGTCGRDFRNVDGFDRHREHGACLDPATVGLVERGGVWATPEGHAAADESRRRLEAARSRRSPVSQSGGKP